MAVIVGAARIRCGEVDELGSFNVLVDVVVYLYFFFVDDCQTPSFRHNHFSSECFALNVVFCCNINVRLKTFGFPADIFKIKSSVTSRYDYDSLVREKRHARGPFVIALVSFFPHLDTVAQALLFFDKAHLVLKAYRL